MKIYNILVAYESDTIVAVGNKQIAKVKKINRRMEMESRNEGVLKRQVLDNLAYHYEIRKIDQKLYNAIKNDDSDLVYELSGLNLSY